MFEKVNPSHPDKLADRIAGAIVDLAYEKEYNPKVAVEVLLGHGNCYIINETSTHLTYEEVADIVCRITGVPIGNVKEDNIYLEYVEVPQDVHLAYNQAEDIRCGDNGIFKGVPLTMEQESLTKIVKDIYCDYPYDGKYILNGNDLIACQSNIDSDKLREKLFKYKDAIINPLGDWTGGINVDSGATNRKLGSDMADSITGGGLHGKDISKADVSVNIWCFVKAQDVGDVVTAYCAIGDTDVVIKEGNKKQYTVPYQVITDYAKYYITKIGGFEKFAEWGLVNGIGRH